MTALRVFLFRLLRRGHDLDSELAAHLDLLVADLEHAGFSPSDARIEARRRLGNLTSVRESYREQRRLPLLDTLSQDLGFAWRQLRRNPAFTIAAILTLALGIGANLAIYQVLDAVVFRELPVRDPQRLVQIQLLDNGRPTHVSYPLFREFESRQQVLDGIFALSDLSLNQASLHGRSPLRGVKGVLVSGSYFRTLGATARIGRTITPEDDRLNTPPVAVLSDAFWACEFNRNPAALGQTIRINDVSAEIIGVMAPEFFGETVGSAPDVWLPLSTQPLLMPGEWLQSPGTSWLLMMGRLKQHITPQQARASLDPLYRSLADLSPTRMGHIYGIGIQPANRGLSKVQEAFEQPLWLLLAIAGLALLIASSNLANLLLGRATARRGEIGVRLALGAGRRRLIRQLLTESLLLGACGAIAALPLARGGARALVALASAETWRLPLEFGWHTFAFTLSIGFFTTCLFGVAPAFAATRVDVQAALQAGRAAFTGSRSGAFTGRFLVVAQIAIALVMLAGAALFTRSLWNLRHQDFGFDAQHVLMADIPLEFTPEVRRRHIALRDPLLEAVTRLPGIRSAAVSGFGPLDSIQHTVGVSSPEHNMQPGDSIRLVHISPHYFDTTQIPILAGRAITVEDQENSPPVIVLSQTAARILFGEANPVGRYVSYERQFSSKNAILVIGVAQDVRFSSARDPFGSVLYVPLTQNPAPITAVWVRPVSKPEARIDPLRAAIAGVDPNLRIGGIRPLAEILESGMGTERTLAILSLSFGLLALALTCVGVYGVIAYAVQRRTREIGLRIALGAGRRGVTGMLVRDIARLIAIGLAIGLAGAMAANRAIHGVLFQVARADYVTMVAAAMVLAVVALAAGYVPARRAARLDPMETLRQE